MEEKKKIEISRCCLGCDVNGFCNYDLVVIFKNLNVKLKKLEVKKWYDLQLFLEN